MATVIAQPICQENLAILATLLVSLMKNLEERNVCVLEFMNLLGVNACRNALPVKNESMESALKVVARMKSFPTDHVSANLVTRRDTGNVCLDIK
jgi:hypothetical protein